MQEDSTELNEDSVTPGDLTGELALIRERQKPVLPTTELDKDIEAKSPVEVNDTYGGRVFKASRVELHSFSSTQMRELMEKVGFKYILGEDGTTIEDALMPDPERIKTAASLNDIPILFSSDTQGGNSRISANEYASIVASRYHPVSDSSLSYYSHDIKVDHLPAVIVCGESLFKIFETGTKYFQGEAHAYDTFTSQITNAIESLFKGNKEEYESLIYTVCTGILNGYENRKAIDENGTGERLNTAIQDGLKRLNIDRPSPASSNPK